MGIDFESYIQQLQLIGFFSGFPLIYAIVSVIAGPAEKRNEFRNNLVRFLPLSYGLAGILFLGFIFQNYDRKSWMEVMRAAGSSYLLTAFGILAIFFLLPILRRPPWLSLLHSLVFFGLFVKEIFFQPSPDIYRRSNNMKVYTDSLILQAGCFIAILLLFYLFKAIRLKSKH